MVLSMLIFSSRLARQTKKLAYPQTRTGRSGGSRDLIPSVHRIAIGLPSSKMSMGSAKGKSESNIGRSRSSERRVSLVSRTHHYSTTEENLETMQRQRLNGRCVHRTMDTFLFDNGTDGLSLIPERSTTFYPLRCSIVRQDSIVLTSIVFFFSCLSVCLFCYV